MSFIYFVGTLLGDFECLDFSRKGEVKLYSSEYKMRNFGFEKVSLPEKR